VLNNCKKYITALGAVFFSTTVLAAGRSPVERDAVDYAIASCLFHQKEAYLKDQGDATTSFIIQRSHGDLDHFMAINTAVKEEAAKSDIPALQTENMHSKALPILYCLDMIDQPPVQKAIATAIAKLKPAYKK
jgi:hypothetical protein